MGGLFSKAFNPATDLPSLTGKVAIVTGANSGLGFQTALVLASHGAKVYVAARSEAKALDAIRRMEAKDKGLVETGRLIWLPLDLSSIKKAKQAAEEFMSKESRLDLLVNNAGIPQAPFALTEEGFEQSIATNHLGHFVFTKVLLPTLKDTAKLVGSDVRIINVSARTYTFAPGNVTFATTEEFKKPWTSESSKDGTIGKFRRYGLSKLANILFTNELQRRLDREGVPALTISLCPGTVATEGALRVLKSMLGFLDIIILPFVTTPERGATTSLFAAGSPEVKAHSAQYRGQFLVPYGKIQRQNKQASDGKLAEQLWKISEEIVDEVLSRASS